MNCRMRTVWREITTGTREARGRAPTGSMPSGCRATQEAQARSRSCRARLAAGQGYGRQRASLLPVINAF